jgi:hypothetical protein
MEKDFLIFKSGEVGDSWEDGLDESANRIAKSMVRFVEKPPQGPVNPQADLARLPKEWLGSNNHNVPNIVLFDPALGYVMRQPNMIEGLGKKYLRIKCRPELLVNYSLYINLETLKPKHNHGNPDFNLNNKIDEITIDGILVTTLDPISNLPITTLEDLVVLTEHHRLNIRDLSLPLEDCHDHRAYSDRMDDMYVHNLLNTGILINGEGHIIHSLKYNINGWLHEEPHHETHSGAQFMSVLAEKAPERHGMFIIPFSGHIENKVWPDSSADLSRLESTELIIKIEDSTRHYYIDSPFHLFRSEFRERGSEIHTFCTYVKFPIDIVKGVVEYIPSDQIRKTIDDMITLKSKFRIPMPPAQSPQTQKTMTQPSNNMTQPSNNMTQPSNNSGQGQSYYR